MNFWERSSPNKKEFKKYLIRNETRLCNLNHLRFFKLVFLKRFFNPFTSKKIIYGTNIFFTCLGEVTFKKL